MSDTQKEFLEEYDRRFKQMRTFLLTLLGVLLTVLLSVGAMNIEGMAANKQRSLENDKHIKYIMGQVIEEHLLKNNLEILI